MYFIISAAVSLIDIVTLLILKISIKNQVHSKNCKKHQKNGSTEPFFFMELTSGVEPPTSSLPMKCSAY